MNFLTVSGEEELLEQLMLKLRQSASLLVRSALVLVLAESASVLVLSGLEELSLSGNLFQERDHAPRVAITLAKLPRKAARQRRAVAQRNPTHTRAAFRRSRILTRAVVLRNHIRGGAHGQRRVALTRVILENPGLSRGLEADLALEEDIT